MDGYVSESGWLLVNAEEGNNTRNIGELVVTGSVPDTVIGKTLAPTPVKHISHVGSRLILHVQVEVGVYLRGTSEAKILCAVPQAADENQPDEVSFVFEQKTLGSLEVGDLAIIVNTLEIAQKQLILAPVTQVEPYGFDEVYEVVLEDEEEAAIINGFVVR